MIPRSHELVLSTPGASDHSRSIAIVKPPTIRILLVDDHPTLRTGLANVLSCERDFTVVAEADDGAMALALWRQHRPDIMLLDVSLPGMDGIETLEKLRAEFPDARVLMLTSSEAAEDVRHALSAGALGYVTKEIRRPELIAAIRAVARGERAISDPIARELAAADEESSISRREGEVLGLLRQGFTNGEIGRLLGITERTAKAHVAALLIKLNASDRAEAVARGFERGLLKP
jgi:DNA-binding NarL/FixJ family response regulator